MIGKIVMILAVLLIACFVAYILFTKEPLNKAYIKYIIFAYPFLSIDLIPSILSFNIFDFVTLVFFLFFYSKPQSAIYAKSLYPFIWLILLIVITVGIVYSEEVTRDTITAIIQLGTIYLFITMLYRELLLNASLKKEILQGARFLLIFSFVFLLLQYIIGPSFSFAKSENINVAGGAAIRYPSFFQDPQKYAQFLAALSFVVLVGDQHTSLNQKRFSIILALLSLCALLLTGGRAGLGGWLFGFLLVGLFLIQLIVCN